MSIGRLASAVRARGNFLPRALLAVVQVVAISWFSPGRGLPLDDAWIHQVVARTFAETGTLGYTPGAHGAAATSYLWAALLAVDFKLHLLEPSRWALVLNTLAALVTGQLLLSILVRAQPAGIPPLTWRITSFAATLLATISPNLLWFVCSGMEAMPFVALSLTAIWAATSEEPGARRPMIAGVAAGALALLRPEAAPLGGLLAAHALLRKRPRNIAPIVVPWIACVAVYVGSNVVKTGHALPSTLAGRRWLWFEMSSGLSRADRGLDFLDAWTTRLGSFTFDTSPAVVWALVAVAAYGAVCLARGSGAGLRASKPSEDAPRLVFAWALFHAAFYALLLPTPGHGGRYQPLTPLLFLACLPLGVAFLLRQLTRIVRPAAQIRFGWFAAVAVAPWIVLAAPIASSLRHANALAVAHIQATEIGVGEFIDRLPDGAVASFDIGGSGYAARRHVLDLGGLSDPQTASLLESGRIWTWLEANKVRWVVLPQPYDPTLPTFEEYRTRLHLAENAAISLTPVRAFETSFDKWMPAIRATWNAAPKQVVYEVAYNAVRGPREVGLVDARARRPISDPAHLVPTRERVVAEHMLATLAAWDLPVDVKITPAPPEGAALPPAVASADAAASGGAAANGPCTITFGWWGLTIDGCTSAGDPLLLRTSAYEHASRYIDVGDLGGALRVLPHVIAQIRRRSDSGFHPPLAPLMQPLPGGVFISPFRAGGYGLVLFGGVLVAAFIVEAIARKRARRTRSAATRAVTPIAATLLVPLVFTSAGCCPDNDVTRAVARGRGAVETALANGGSVERGAGRAPILEAAHAGDAEIVALLLARGARLDVRDAAGATPLHLAARRGHVATVAVLAAAMTAKPETAALIDLPAGARRRTALHDAAMAGSVDAVTVLLRASADPNKPDLFGQTAIHLIATIDPLRADAVGVVLVQAGANPLVVDARGFTALHAAAVTDNVPLVKRLTARESLLETRSPAGESALDLALRYGSDRAAESLLAAGAAMKREDMLPPLHQAARMDAIGRAAALVASGADARRLVQGKTALDVAVESGSKQVEALLRERSR